jgi:tetratricopeptide (TPR) repeat protein
MKHVLLILTIIFSLTLLFAETDATTEYFSNPTPQTFSAAWTFCTDALAQDSTQVSLKIFMAYLANAEATRLTNEILPLADSLDTMGKFQFANLLLSQNKYVAAIEIYDVLNADAPGWSCPWRHKGQSLYSLGRYKEAEVALTQAIETNREHYDAYVWMAKTQYQLKKYKAALGNIETAMTLSPSAEESPGEAITEASVNALHQQLLIKNHKKATDLK